MVKTRMANGDFDCALLGQLSTMLLSDILMLSTLLCAFVSFARHPLRSDVVGQPFVVALLRLPTCANGHVTGMRWLTVAQSSLRL